MTLVTLPAAAQRQLVLNELGENRGTTLVMAVRLTGHLNVPALHHAFARVVARHDALRTAVDPHGATTDGHVLPTADLHVRLVDLSRFPATAAEQHLQRLLGCHVHRPFDRSRPPSLRVDVVELAPDHHVAVVAADHLAVDGWSLGVLAREVSGLYDAARAGRADALLPPPELVGDGPEDLTAGDRVWLERVSRPSQDDVPGAVRRPAAARGPAAVHRVVLPPTLATAVEEARRRSGGTPFMAVLTAWIAVLHRLDGRHATTVASLTSGRTSPDRERAIAHLGKQTLLQPVAMLTGRVHQVHVK